MAGLDSTESVVLLYYDHDPDRRNGPVQMIGLFRALDGAIEGQVVTVTNWKQRGGTLPVHGDSGVIRSPHCTESLMET